MSVYMHLGFYLRGEIIFTVIERREGSCNHWKGVDYSIGKIFQQLQAYAGYYYIYSLPRSALRREIGRLRYLRLFSAPISAIEFVPSYGG
jgi:hypothetical protein